MDEDNDDELTNNKNFPTLFSESYLIPKSYIKLLINKHKSLNGTTHSNVVRSNLNKQNDMLLSSLTSNPSSSTKKIQFSNNLDNDFFTNTTNRKSLTDKTKIIDIVTQNFGRQKYLALRFLNIWHKGDLMGIDIDSNTLALIIDGKILKFSTIVEILQFLYDKYTTYSTSIETIDTGKTKIGVPNGTRLLLSRLIEQYGYSTVHDLFNFDETRMKLLGFTKPSNSKESSPELDTTFYSESDPDSDSGGEGGAKGGKEDKGSGKDSGSKSKDKDDKGSGKSDKDDNNDAVFITPPPPNRPIKQEGNSDLNRMEKEHQLFAALQNLNQSILEGQNVDEYEKKFEKINALQKINDQDDQNLIDSINGLNYPPDSAERNPKFFNVSPPNFQHSTPYNNPGLVDDDDDDDDDDNDDDHQPPPNIQFPNDDQDLDVALPPPNSPLPSPPPRPPLPTPPPTNPPDNPPRIQGLIATATDSAPIAKNQGARPKVLNKKPPSKRRRKEISATETVPRERRTSHRLSKSKTPKESTLYQMLADDGKSIQKYTY